MNKSDNYDENMNKKIEISAAEAQSSLASVNEIKDKTNQNLRMPLWLNFVASFSYGMGVFSWASTRHENQWMLGVIFCAIVFALTLVFYMWSQRLLGIKPKIRPKNKKDWVFGLSIGIFFIAVINLTRYFSINGVEYAAYIGGIIATLTLGYLNHQFPSGEYRGGAIKHDAS